MWGSISQNKITLINKKKKTPMFLFLGRGIQDEMLSGTKRHII